MPRVDDLLTLIGGAKHLNKLDLNKGFHQVPVQEQGREKTAFCTPWGRWEYNMMPFGLRNAPAIFQRMMYIILADTPRYAQAYMDDVVIYSDTWEEHLDHISGVLQRLQQHGLTVKPEKCQWEATTIDFLGHVVGDGKILVPDCRVAAIKSHKRPITQKDLQSFLGITRYYRRFIDSYAHHSFHLTNAIRKNKPNTLVWSPDMCR